MLDSNYHRATLLGLFSIIVWGFLALLTSLTDGRVPPFQLLSMVFTIAFLLMMGRWITQGHFGLKYIKQPILAWFLGIYGLFAYHFFYFLAMTKAPAIEVSLIAYLWPLLIVIFSALLPHERLTPYHLIGGIIALAGCWLLIGAGKSQFNSQYMLGYAIAFACAILWASYSVASRLVKEVPTDAVGWFCGVTAILGFICHWFFEQTQWPETTTQWLSILGIGLGPMGIAFFTWDYGVKHGNLPLIGVLSYAAPLISALALVVAGRAEPSWTIALAACAIVGGALLASRAGKKDTQSST
ncbi:DMT family transporter [Thiolinea disciformis]|uniref:aromatic amino acid exporter YddG n=1 Tax=Thiolinea disciformis TaxID=125614 RepID=UPI000364EF5D|nr:EamA family transporter [Thiolinea disciformis]